MLNESFYFSFFLIVCVCIYYIIDTYEIDDGKTNKFNANNELVICGIKKKITFIEFFNFLHDCFLKQNIDDTSA